MRLWAMKKLFILFWQYIERHFPNAALRYIHASLAILILFQIINSNLVHVSSLGSVKGGDIGEFGLWLHIISGILATLLTLVLCAFLLKTKSVKDFYPYLWGDFQQIKADGQQLLKRIWPDSHPRGMANVVQGLGVLALLGTEITAIIWLILWYQHWPLADTFRELHKFCTGWVEAYIIVHGSLALLRFVYEWRLGRR
jgi:hypothetical protein